jgi:large subunit ribosomal protein L17
VREQYIILGGDLVDKKKLINLCPGDFDRVFTGFFGGFAVCDNRKKEVLRRGEMETMWAIIASPKKKEKTDKYRMLLYRYEADLIWDECLKGNLYVAMRLNSLLYGDKNAPKVKGRIITTLQKAKEVRPLVERCITIARRALPHQDAADELEPHVERHSEKWRAWRNSKQWYEWNQTVAPVVAARRRVLRLLGDKQAMAILFDDIAPRFADRAGGYTRVLRLATPRLGDAGPQAILEFVGTHDRVRRRAPKPTFETQPAAEPSARPAGEGAGDADGAA